MLLTALGGAAAARAVRSTDCSVGPGQGVEIPNPDPNPCPPAALYVNYDGSAEDGYCWQYGGVAPPCHGAFAERFTFPTVGCICGIELTLTGLGGECIPCDLYVWADAGGAPGNVLSVSPGANPCPVATWPVVSSHDLPLSCGVQVDPVAWAGYWADYSDRPCGYYVTADLNGVGGSPYTNIPPGIGYPTGWNDVSVVWGPTRALGIGAWYLAGYCGGESGACCYEDGHCVQTCRDGCPTGNWLLYAPCDPNPCGPAPVRDESWGRVKRLYARSTGTEGALGGARVAR